MLEAARTIKALFWITLALVGMVVLVFMSVIIQRQGWGLIGTILALLIVLGGALMVAIVVHEQVDDLDYYERYARNLRKLRSHR